MKRVSEKGKVSFSLAMNDFFKGYFDFRGRSTRAGYWWPKLGIALIYIALIFFDVVGSVEGNFNDPWYRDIITVVMVIFTISLIVPNTTLSVRRLRDVGLRSKTILALFILSYSAYGTIMMNVYSGILDSLSYLESGAEDTFVPTFGMDFMSSPFLVFLYILLTMFVMACYFLPTDMFATKSKNKVLTAIFHKKEIDSEL